MPFDRPNYTAIPNQLLGDRRSPGLMAAMSGSRLKVLLAVCRLTFGFHRRSAGATFRQIQSMTGLANRREIWRAAAWLEEQGLVTHTTDDDGETVWTVVVEGDAEELVQQKPTRGKGSGRKGQDDQPLLI